MSYICLDCGRIFEDGEQKNWSESRGEFWGVSCSEEMSGCPDCGGDYEEAKQCEVCGKDCCSEDLTYGVCNECIDNAGHNFELCEKICGDEKKEIKINALLASLFDVGDIEHILKEFIRYRWKDVDCSPFIDEDKSWFGERLAEEVKKNENKKN